MYILSITFVVEPYADSNWRVYFRDEVDPLIKDKKTTLCRVLSEHHNGHFTYSLQVQLDDLTDYNTIKEGVANSLLKMNFGESILHFSTLMKEIER